MRSQAARKGLLLMSCIAAALVVCAGGFYAASSYLPQGQGTGGCLPDCQGTGGPGVPTAIVGLAFKNLSQPVAWNAQTKTATAGLTYDEANDSLFIGNDTGRVYCLAIPLKITRTDALNDTQVFGVGLHVPDLEGFTPFGAGSWLINWSVGANATAICPGSGLIGSTTETTAIQAFGSSFVTLNVAFGGHNGSLGNFGKMATNGTNYAMSIGIVDPITQQLDVSGSITFDWIMSGWVSE